MKNNFYLSISLSFFLIFSSSAVKPLKDYIRFPDTSLVNLKEFYLKESKNDSILTWHYTPKNKSLEKNTTIIISYGDYGNMSYWIDQATILTQLGFNVYTYDYRGFGKSSSMKIEENYLYYDEFCDDLLNVYNMAKIEQPNNEIGFLGYSMGSLIGMLTLDKINHYGSKIDFIISEGQIIKPFLLSKKLTELKNKSIIVPINSKNLDIKKISKKYCKKILVFVGKEDKLINDQFDVKKAIKYGWKIKYYNAGHLGGVEALTKEKVGDIYFEIIEKFILDK